MAYLEEQIEESRRDTALPLSSLTGMLGRQPTPRARKNGKAEVAHQYVCVDCGGPRSYGFGQRCKKCFADKAAARRRVDEVVSAGSKPPQTDARISVVPKPDKRQGPAYKPLDLTEVEEVMATEETVAKAAAKLGLTAAQLYTRRLRDEAVDKAVDRGRERYYSTAPEIDIHEDEESGIGSMPESAQVKRADVVTQDETSDKNLTLVQPITSSTVRQIAWDDDFFPNAYDTLIAILDDGMDHEEKQAVWTLILYLKRIQAEQIQEQEQA